MKQAAYTVDPREAYKMQLRQIRAKMATLEEILDETIGDGRYSDSIEWSDVGLARKMNLILTEAVQIGL